MPLYDHPSEMEPLIPQKGRSELAELTTAIYSESGKISSMPLNKVVEGKVKKLLRLVNCYYSNLIEGQPTTPSEIEKAQAGDLRSVDDEKRDLQILGKTHVEVQEFIESRLSVDPSTNVFGKEWICGIHREFYTKLPESYHLVRDAEGNEFSFPIGEFRDSEVKVKNHTPPVFGKLDDFIDRFESFYSNIDYKTTHLIAIASSHHRFEWIHPFGDGNGRVGRLLTHSALIKEGIAGYGLWSLDRGLARNIDSYYKFLGMADSRRIDDYDGRGARSDKHLQLFCKFFLEQMLDQITFMSEKLQFHNLLSRMEKSIRDRFPREDQLNDKEESQIKSMCHHLLVDGSISKGDLAQKIGVSKNIGTKIIQKALELRVIEQSPGNKHHVELVIDTKAAAAYFPDMGF